MKLIAILISALLALGASAEPALETISGTVTEYVESEYMMLDTAEHGEIQVNLSAETPMETDGAIQTGDYVYVAFDGTMTMSLPAQISAKNVTMHKLKGDIVEVKDGDALIRTSDGTEVLVHLPDDWANAELDAAVDCVLQRRDHDVPARTDQRGQDRSLLHAERRGR